MKKLNSNHLKLISIIAMTIDHIADLIYQLCFSLFVKDFIIQKI